MSVGAAAIRAVEQGTAQAVQEPPITGAVAVSASDTATVDPGRQFAIMCTVAGNLKVGFLDGTTITIPVVAGLTLLPWAVKQVFATNTTATATYANLT